MGFFLLERYVPSTSASEIEGGTGRLAARPEVRHVLTVFVASEEVCLSVLEAVNAAAIQQAAELADLQADRIVEVRLLASSALSVSSG